MLDIVPSFTRHLKQYIKEEDTDSNLAAYLADGIEALDWRWGRDYVITVTQPNTYNVTPDVAMKDKRPVILMASIIYKMGNVELAGFTDGDFAYNPQQGRNNPLATDIAELGLLVPVGKRLGLAASAPLRGFSNGYNPESYSWLTSIGVLGARP